MLHDPMPQIFELGEKVKLEISTWGYEVWKMVINYNITKPFSQKDNLLDEQGRCVMYDNFHDWDIEKITDLNTIREIWDRFHSLHGIKIWKNDEEKEK